MSTQIKTILDHLLGQSDNWQIKLLNDWPAIVGTIGTKVQLLKIMDDTLIIGVLDSCWLQELYLLSPLLIQTINEKLDRPRIKKLRLKAVGITDKKVKKEAPKKKNIHRVVHLCPREQETLSKIEDEQLRQSLKDYLIRCYRENV